MQYVLTWFPLFKCPGRLQRTWLGSLHLGRCHPWTHRGTPRVEILSRRPDRRNVYSTTRGLPRAGPLSLASISTNVCAYVLGRIVHVETD